MYIIGKNLNKIKDNFKNYEDFTVEENDNTYKESEARKNLECEMNKIITSQKCRLIKSLRIIETTKVEMEAFKERMDS